jgi:DNA-binding CsgD family transcriptional regulator
MIQKLLGIGVFIIFAVIIMGFDQNRLIDSRSLAAVLSGTAILTLSQLYKKIKVRQIIVFARWNAFFSGLLITLLTFLTRITDPELLSGGGSSMVAFVPVIYGSVLFLIFDWLSDQSFIVHEKTNKYALNDSNDSNDTNVTTETTQTPVLSIQQATEVLTAHGFSPREVHVALKIIDNCTNKSIATQLYISEATVKKHIQNMFRKCGAEDRAAFIDLYKIWTVEYFMSVSQ